MMYIAHITIMPLAELLDPQGKAVTGSLHSLGLATINHVRVGKHITLQVEAASEESASELVEQACQKLLVNAVMETYKFSIEKH